MLKYFPYNVLRSIIASDSLCILFREPAGYGLRIPWGTEKHVRFAARFFARKSANLTLLKYMAGS